MLDMVLLAIPASVSRIPFASVPPGTRLNECVGKEHSNGVVFFFEAALAAERLPGACLFILSDHETVLARVADDPHVLYSLSCSADVLTISSDGSADCGHWRYFPALKAPELQLMLMSFLIRPLMARKGRHEPVLNLKRIKPGFRSANDCTRRDQDPACR